MGSLLYGRHAIFKSIFSLVLTGHIQEVAIFLLSGIHSRVTDIGGHRYVEV
jgi:hypothetical protein